MLSSRHSRNVRLLGSISIRAKNESFTSTPALATFNAVLTPVPAGHAWGWVSPGGYGDVEAREFSGTLASGIEIKEA